MPTVIALDVSLSMTRQVPNQLNNDESATYHQLAVQGINCLLDHLSKNSKLEFVSLIIYSSLYEVIVDFTRDYEVIRQALHKIDHYDKTCLENTLVAVNNIIKTQWGNQNFCQVIVITDGGIGLGATSLKNTILNIQNFKKQSSSGIVGLMPQIPINDNQWLSFSVPSKLTFMLLGNVSDSMFIHSIKLHQQLLSVSGQKGQIITPKSINPSLDEAVTEDNSDDMKQLNRKSVIEMFEGMCEVNFKQFEGTLKCGGYFKLEGAITVWPPPLPYSSRDVFGNEATKMISRNLEVCGFLSLSDIGSPMSVSRHLILPRTEGDKSKLSKEGRTQTSDEKLEHDIKVFYAKTEGIEDDDNLNTNESICVLLHGALKVENMAALVLLNENWFGFIYSYADSKKKSNLMLNVLPPGNDVIPWLGDLRYLGTIDDAFPGENPNFPVKPEKRSYSQNIVVWIRQAGLQSDIQKVLRHAKKLPEKTQHFYKELNRIRRAALSFGFIELLEGLSVIFEREIATLPSNSSPDCAIQLKHAANELRKSSNRDLKTLIQPLPTSQF